MMAHYKQAGYQEFTRRVNLNRHCSGVQKSVRNTAVDDRLNVEMMV